MIVAVYTADLGPFRDAVRVLETLAATRRARGAGGWPEVDVAGFRVQIVSFPSRHVRPELRFRHPSCTLTVEAFERERARAQRIFEAVMEAAGVQGFISVA